MFPTLTSGKASDKIRYIWKFWKKVLDSLKIFISVKCAAPQI